MLGRGEVSFEAGNLEESLLAAARRVQCLVFEGEGHHLSDATVAMVVAAEGAQHVRGGHDVAAAGTLFLFDAVLERLVVAAGSFIAIIVIVVGLEVSITNGQVRLVLVVFDDTVSVDAVALARSRSRDMVVSFSWGVLCKFGANGILELGLVAAEGQLKVLHLVGAVSVSVAIAIAIGVGSGSLGELVGIVQVKLGN